MFRRLHRNTVLTFMMKKENAIDSAVEYDNNQFWKLVNKNKSKLAYTPGFEMTFEGKMLTHPKEINSGWKSHFRKLYSFFNHDAFDNNYKKYVDEELKGIIQHTVASVCSDDRVTTAMTKRAL